MLIPTIIGIGLARGAFLSGRIFLHLDLSHSLLISTERNSWSPWVYNVSIDSLPIVKN